MRGRPLGLNGALSCYCIRQNGPFWILPRPTTIDLGGDPESRGAACLSAFRSLFLWLESLGAKKDFVDGPGHGHRWGSHLVTASLGGVV